MIAQHQGLPDQDRAARERVDRAPPAARGLRRRDHPLAGRRGLQRRGAPGAGAGRRAPRVGVPLPVRQRGQPAGPLRDHRSRDLARLPRDHPLRRRPRHERHADGRRARSSRSRTPTSRSSPSSRRSASWSRACATSTRATSRRCTRSGAAPELLDGKRIVRPRESIEWTRRLAEQCGIFAGHLRRRGAGRRGARWPSEIESGTIVFIVCDGGWKYLSTGAWTDDIDEVVDRAEKIIYF